MWSPYQPPCELNHTKTSQAIDLETIDSKTIDSETIDTDEKVSTVGLVTSAGSLLIPFGIVGLVFLDVMAIRWDSNLPSLLTFCLSVPLAITGFLISTAACLRHRSRKAALGIVVAVAAIPLSIAVAWLLGMASLAACPI